MIEDGVVKMKKQRMMSIAVAGLAVAQGLLGWLRALDWFRVGADLGGQGIFILPLMGAVAYGRGGLIFLIALLYVIFAAGTLLAKGWGWWSGLIAALLNVLLVWGVLREGERIAESIFWLIVPLLVICYLFSRFGRQQGSGSIE
jgi:hypothetical protein